MFKKFADKKAFTLMEMLIVVAIIAVLVAIAIPTFSGQIERANEAADAANIRAAYAEAVLDAMEHDGSGEATTSAKMKCGDWNKLDDAGLEEIGGVTIDKISKTKGSAIKVTVTDGKASFAAVA